jgi:hypothetical protein
MKLILILIFTSFSLSIFSQDIQLENEKKKEVELKVFKENYKSYLTKALSNLSTSNSFSSLGNFAAVSTTDESLKASIFLLDKKRTSMFTFTLSAGAANGISTLFNKGKLNSKTSVGAEVRFLPDFETQLIDINSSEKYKFQTDITELNEANDLAILQVIKTLQSGKKNFKENEKLEKRLDSINIELDKLETWIEKEKLVGDTKMTNNLGNIKTKLNELKARTVNQMCTDINLDYYTSEVDRLNEKNDEKVNAIKEKIDALQPKAFHLKFISLGYSATREDFMLFDESLIKDKQLFKEDYVTQTFSGAINLASNLKKYKDTVNNIKSKKKVYGLKRFFSGGFKLSLTNNISGLKKFKVTDTQNVDNVPNRVLISEEEALVGDYKKDIIGFSLYSDNYIFLDKKSSYAIHFNPEYIIKEFQKPITSIQIGLLIPFKKTDEQTSKVNLEFFYQINDLFNNVLDENSFQRRNQIGVQTAFPLNF